MNRVVEIRVYRLKPGKRGDFHALVMSASLPARTLEGRCHRGGPVARRRG